MSASEAEYLSYELLGAAEVAARGGEPTAAQMESLNNPDSGPYHESSPSYRRAMGEAGRGGLLR